MEKCCLFNFIYQGRRFFTAWKNDTKETFHSQNRAICVGFFRYVKQAWGCRINHLIYAANVLVSSVTESFCLFTAPLPNSQPEMIVFFLDPNHLPMHTDESTSTIQWVETTWSSPISPPGITPLTASELTRSLGRNKRKLPRQITALRWVSTVLSKIPVCVVMHNSRKRCAWVWDESNVCFLSWSLVMQFKSQTVLAIERWGTREQKIVWRTIQ